MIINVLLEKQMENGKSTQTHEFYHVRSLESLGVHHYEALTLTVSKMQMTNDTVFTRTRN